jgi:hypothetical protein
VEKRVLELAVTTLEKRTDFGLSYVGYRYLQRRTKEQVKAHWLESVTLLKVTGKNMEGITIRGTIMKI